MLEVYNLLDKIDFLKVAGFAVAAAGGLNQFSVQIGKGTGHPVDFCFHYHFKIIALQCFGGAGVPFADIVG